MKAQVETVLEGLGKKGLMEKGDSGDMPLTETKKEEEDSGSDVWEELRKEFG